MFQVLTQRIVQSDTWLDEIQLGDVAIVIICHILAVTGSIYGPPSEKGLLRWALVQKMFTLKVHTLYPKLRRLQLQPGEILLA